MYGFDFSKEPRTIRETREEATIDIISRQLPRRLQQEIPETVLSRLTTLSLPVLEDLYLALLDFKSLEDLESWISLHSSSAR